MLFNRHPSSYAVERKQIEPENYGHVLTPVTALSTNYNKHGKNEVSDSPDGLILTLLQSIVIALIKNGANDPLNERSQKNTDKTKNSISFSKDAIASS